MSDQPPKQLTAWVTRPAPGGLQSQFLEGELKVEITIRGPGPQDAKRITFDAGRVEFIPSVFLLRALPTSMINVDTSFIATIAIAQPESGLADYVKKQEAE